MKKTILQSWWFEAIPNALTTLANLAYNELFSRYAEPQRYYHNVRHLHALLYLIDQQDLSPIDRQILILVTFYHDAIYLPGSTQNEQRSAELAQYWLPQLGVSRPVIDQVYQIILDTATHVSCHALSNTFLDMDLSILGAAPKQYATYGQQIRQETPVPSLLFALGRKRFLKSFLQRERIFQTPFFYHRLEQQARYNLQAELDQM
jgi:predicted metal-dependent HD superfamily phosphohydrolase